MSESEASSGDAPRAVVAKLDEELLKLSAVQKRKATNERAISNKRLVAYVVSPPSSPATSRNSIQADDDDDDDASLHFDELNRPNGKWRELGIHINFQPIMDSKSIDAVQRIAYKDFYTCHERAVITEAERVRKRLDQIKKDGKGKRPTPRPTDRAWQYLREMRSFVNQECTFGHVPGVAVGDQFEYKVQMKAVGIHKIVLAGIDYIGKSSGREDIPSLALSIVVAGGYEDDDDNGTEMIYTGQGGNDLLGRKRQWADQKLERGTLALSNNAEYGIPVRVTKRNGNRFIYDGLWDVLSMIKRTGAEGYIVYQFRLTRCPGQESSTARQVRFREGQKLKHAPASLAVVDEICSDFSRGLNHKPISVVNDVDNSLPPGLTPDDVTAEARSKKDWKTDVASFIFGTEMRYDDRVIPPITPDLPEEFSDDPHLYLLTLNHGSLPYQSGGLVHHAMCVLHECGDWMHCKRGSQCHQRTTHRSTDWKFQIFKTRNRGWGIRTLSKIPSGSFIMKYIGEVFRDEDDDEEDDYSYDMTERPDFDEENRWLAVPRAVESKHVVTGKRYGNLFRFVNHSCNPSCFVQPVLGHHLDRTQPDICIFAMRDILPGEELSYDYGRAYIEQRLKICKCGSACCVSRNIVETIEI